MKYLLIANPVSGPKSDSMPLLGKVVAKIAAEGHVVTLHVTEREGHGYEIAQSALHSDYDVIVAVGGDGTVNEVAHALVHSDKIMGIIPNGSGNGLARELMIPMDAMKAVDTLLRHEVATIDTCRANDEPFFVTCGIGFDGKVSKKFAKSDIRGVATYVREVISEYFSYKPRQYHLFVDDYEVTAKALVIAVANASQYGNNAFIAPKASMEDGELDVTILKDFPTGEAAKIVLQLFSKELAKSDYTSFFRGKKIEIKVDSPVNYHIDGEPKSKNDHLVIEVIPASLRVLHGGEKDRTKTVFDFFKDATNSFQEVTEDMTDLFK
ncbi:diacylglycerol/lipid kinase family protein [Porphyromonas levii]|uniref:diacylglycerol/lipid kinase family protein n=1 Tax=Porphyromonas levii TaxID=28114 RepID=UPI0003819887|nr:diacylglycerol kinase family protein [Porphyromonas levii]